MFQKIFYLLAFTLVSGCAFIPKGSFESKAGLSNLECKKTPVRVGFVAGLNFTPDRLRFRDISDPNNSDDFLDKIVLDEINKSGAFELVKEVKPKHIIGFTYHNNDHNSFLSWLTVLTLGIIPIKQDSEMWINVRVFDPSEQLIYESDSFKLDYDRYTGWLVAPFISKDKSISFRELNEKYIPLMIKELINGMSNKNILDCKK